MLGLSRPFDSVTHKPLDRLAKEGGKRRVQALQMDYDESLAATIELSLNSPTCPNLARMPVISSGWLLSSHKVWTKKPQLAFPHHQPLRQILCPFISAQKKWLRHNVGTNLGLSLSPKAQTHLRSSVQPRSVTSPGCPSTLTLTNLDSESQSGSGRKT